MKTKIYNIDDELKIIEYIEKCRKNNKMFSLFYFERKKNFYKCKKYIEKYIGKDGRDLGYSTTEKPSSDLWDGFSGKMKTEVKWGV